MTRILPLAWLLLACLPTSAQQLWIVDDQPGPQVDFLVIQDAVDAAGPADVIVVQSGTYDSFIVDGKSALVTGDGLVQVRSCRVRNLGAGDSVVLQGLSFYPQNTSGFSVHLSSSAGTLLIDDCELRSGFSFASAYQAALIAEDSGSVVISHSTLSGQIGSYPGEGVHAIGPCAIALYGSTVLAGNGMWETSGRNAITYGDGTSLHIVGCDLKGGDGGWTDIESWGWCSYPGGGGWILGSGFFNPTMPPQLYWADNVATPGLGGDSYCGDTSPPGQVAVWPQFVLVSEAQEQVGLTLLSPISDTDAVQLTLKGKAGASVFLAVAGDPDFLELPGLPGLLFADPTSAMLLPLGSSGPNGIVNQVWPAPLDLPPGMGLSLVLQGVFLDAAGIDLGSPAALVVTGS